MGFISRIIRLLKGEFDEKVHEAELKNPEIVLKNAITAKRKNLSDLVDATARMAHYRNALRQTFADNLQKMQVLESKIRIAVKDKDAITGPRACCVMWAGAICSSPRPANTSSRAAPTARRTSWPTLTSTAHGCDMRAWANHAGERPPWPTSTSTSPTGGIGDPATQPGPADYDR